MELETNYTEPLERWRIRLGLFVVMGRDSDTGLLPLFLKVPWGERPPLPRKHPVVLQWGIPSQEPVGSEVLNPLRHLLRAKHSKSVMELWRLNGLKPAEGEQVWIHEYQIPVFHMEALGVWGRSHGPAGTAATAAWKPGGGKAVGVGSNPRKRAGSDRHQHSPQEVLRFRELSAEEQGGFHIRRAKRDAVRAVYALGLTSAMVEIGIGRDGGTYIQALEPAPKLTDRLAELFGEAINRLHESLEDAEHRENRDYVSRDKRQVLLGADPEFVLRRPDGRFVSASKYLEREGVVGCDAVVLSRSKVIYPLAELRPKPHREPIELVKELHRTMRQAAKMIGDPSLAWLAGSMPAKGLPIGGHVHVSGIWMNERLLRALDNYVALPLVLAEGVSAGQRKPRYGFLGDYRTKRHGGFEYRSLPSWLATPELALAVLALVRTVVLHYRELKQRPLDQIDIQRAYYRGDKEELLPIVMKLWKDLELLPAYKENQKELQAWFQRLRQLEGWEEQADFRKAWKIPPFDEKGATLPSFML